METAEDGWERKCPRKIQAILQDWYTFIITMLNLSYVMFIKKEWEDEGYSKSLFQVRYQSSCPLWAYALMALLLVSPKGLVPMKMYSLLINLWSFLKLANVGLHPNNPQQSSPRIKYNIEPAMRPMELLNSLPLIEAQLLWSPRTKYTFCSTHESFFYYTFEAHNFFVSESTRRKLLTRSILNIYMYRITQQNKFLCMV